MFFKLGIKSFLIEVGGEIIAEGIKPSGKQCTVSIEHTDIENPDFTFSETAVNQFLIQPITGR